MIAYNGFVHRLDTGEPMIPAAHHRRWLWTLQHSTNNIIINAPPGSAKTLHVGVGFPAFSIGEDPNIHIGYISNTARQAQRQSVAVRDTIAENERFSLVFPGIFPDKNKGWAESEWFIKRNNPGDKDATFTASGVFGPILGNRFDLLIFDDIADRENQATKLQRENLIDWVKSTALTRLKPKGRWAYIGTRWRVDDPVAFFKTLPHEQLVTEALSETESGTKSYWPEFWTVEMLLAKLSEFGTYFFNTQYQGRPTVQEGEIIKRDWWGFYRSSHQLPSFKTIIQTWDTAFEAKNEADYSVCQTWGAGTDGRAYLLDIWRRKVEFPELLRAARALYSEWDPDVVVIEDKGSGQSLRQVLSRLGIPLVAYKPDRDKTARLNSVAPLVEGGSVMLPLDLPFTEDFIDEVAAFPRGAYDDNVDGFTLALMRLRPHIGSKVRSDAWMPEQFDLPSRGSSLGGSRVRGGVTELRQSRLPAGGSGIEVI